MTRRNFLQLSLLSASGLAFPMLTAETENQSKSGSGLDPALAKDWLAKWQEHILAEAHHRYCDHEMGEEIGWLVSPFLTAFYYGYRATGDAAWVERLIDWTDAWIHRGVKEPDGYLGWPKGESGGELAKEFYTDSLLEPSPYARRCLPLCCSPLSGAPLGLGGHTKMGRLSSWQ